MSDEKKYELTDETREVDGVTVHRIRALRDVGRAFIRAGSSGGWVESEANLTHTGTAWVGENAVVTGGAVVCQDAHAGGNARVRDRARVTGKAHVSNYAVLRDWASVGGDAYVGGSAELLDAASVIGDGAFVGDRVKLSGNSGVGDNGRVYGNAVLSNSAFVQHGIVDENAVLTRPQHVLTMRGFLEETITLYRAPKSPHGHVLAAGCQRLDIFASTQELEEIAHGHNWWLPPAWKTMRTALRAIVRAWEAEDRDQDG